MLRARSELHGGREVSYRRNSKASRSITRGHSVSLLVVTARCFASNCTGPTLAADLDGFRQGLEPRVVHAWELKCQYGLHLQDRHCICSFYGEVRIDTLPTDKAQLTKHVQERIETVGKHFQELELTAMKAGEVDVRAKIEKARQAITEKRDALEQQLKAAREAGDAALAETREGVVAAWTELNEAFEKAREELEGVTA